MSVVDDYLATVPEPEHGILEHMYSVVRAQVPGATEELSYNMPAFKKDGKAFMAIMVNKQFMSVYPFGNLDRLGMDFSAYETTKGSLHFTAEKPISDELLKEIITTRLSQLG